METPIIVCIIVLAIIIALILLILCFLIYNQMHLVNQVNKRLIVITQESIEHDRATQEQLQEAVMELDKATTETAVAVPPEPEPVPEEPFNPHTYEEENNE